MRLIKEILAPNQAELTGYLPDPSREMPNIDRRPTVLIFPGGGYAMCSDREAEPIAFSYLARGYAAFVLRYTTDARNNTYPAAMQDADAALRQLREQADHYGIDPDKIAVAGFSAGGHLAACLGAMCDEKPSALILGYPVILAQWGRDFGRDLPGADESVTPDTPPCFVFATQADQLVPIENSLAFCTALAKAHVPFEQHIFMDGVHGSSLCTAATSGGKAESVNADMAAWLPMSVRFLQKVWGDFPLFTENVEDQKAWIDHPLPELLKNEAAAALIDTLIPGIRNNLIPGMNLPLRRIAQFSEEMVTDEMLTETERKLQIIMNL